MRAFEKQKGESDIAFGCYKVFRDLGPRRTLREAAAIYYDKPKYRDLTNAVPGHVKQWSAKHDWVGRAQEADERDDLIRREAIELHDLNMGAERNRRVEELHELNLKNEEKAAKIEEKFLDRASELMDTLPLVSQRVLGRDENGNPVAYELKPATKNAIADAERLHKIATRSEPKQVDVKNWDLTTATDEQLQKIINGEDPARVLRGDS